MSTQNTGPIRAPRPTMVQRVAAATVRGIENFGDEVYGYKPDRAGRARQDDADLSRIAVEDAQVREHLDERMEEHTDLLTEEDEYGTEFTDTIERGVVRQFGRELSRQERAYVEEFIEDYQRDRDARGER